MDRLASVSFGDVNSKPIYFLSIIVLLLVLSACGGGGGSSPSTSTSSNGSSTGTTSTPSNADPGGIYSGTFISTTTNQSGSVAAIVTESGKVSIFSPSNGTQYKGTIITNGNTFSSQLTGYAPYGSTFVDGHVIDTFTLSGTVSSGVSISGTYTGGGDSGKFSLTDDTNIYDSGSSLSSLVGTWEGYTPTGAIATITFQADGSFFGQTTDGCTETGNVSIINASYDAFNIVDQEMCGSASTSYSGLFFLALDTTVNANAIFYEFSNASVSVTGELIFQ